ncbi:hypothetical protein L596_021672 [Steinernema carpocapsae]|uniref:Uncharacterized protein n=1 Tax=Steinernema carpocapsae TaxID=34508 RepID=A0A4U5MJH6_STECR|nr:hypothetical protein L596_021672 [Steinernema carpocapsae]
MEAFLDFWCVAEVTGRKDGCAHVSAFFSYCRADCAFKKEEPKHSKSMKTIGRWKPDSDGMNTTPLLFSPVIFKIFSTTVTFIVFKELLTESQLSEKERELFGYMSIKDDWNVLKY